MNEQRKVIYGERRTILEGTEHREQIMQMIAEVVGAYVDGATAEGYAVDWDLEQLWTALRALYPTELDPREVMGENEFGERDDISAEELKEILIEDAQKAYEKREEEITAIGGEDAMRQLERTILLSVLDRKWRDHLYEMDYLREGIHLRSMAQRDPVVEYQREGYDMFTGMLEGLKEETLQYLFNVQVQAEPAPTVTPASAAATAAAAAARQPAMAGATASQNGAGSQGGAGDNNEAPAALRAVGVEAEADVPMTYSGPDEGGGTTVHSQDEELDDPALVSASRRERRAAARASAKREGAKPPKSKRRRR